MKVRILVLLLLIVAMAVMVFFPWPWAELPLPPAPPPQQNSITMPTLPPAQSLLTFTAAGCVHQMPATILFGDEEMRRLMSTWESASDSTNKHLAEQELHRYLTGTFYRGSFCLGPAGSPQTIR
ncbi:hypothetical protein HY491_02365 [Candidatus Woesearchaeota archaeon]|nr:hypothetical protein [Candidatus Woesearchaeota archaeon]